MKNCMMSAHRVIFGMGTSPAALASLLASATALAGVGDGWVTMSPYQSIDDSPFVAAGVGNLLILDSFESETRSLGLSVDAGARLVGNSVDSDDTSIDGNGALGSSLAIGSWIPMVPAAVGLQLSAADLGGAPTRIGVVVTSASIEDGLGAIVGLPLTFIVELADGTFVNKQLSVLSLPDNAGDDVFLGFTSPLGITAVFVSSAAPFAIDHIQYDSAPALVPNYVRDDVNLDGKSDIYWNSKSMGEGAVWVMDGVTRTSSVRPSTTTAPNAAPVGLGDLDGDRIADFIWRNPATGALSAWLMSTTGVGSQGTLGSALGMEWEALAVGDINGDRKADIVFKNTSTGMIKGWLMNGLSIGTTQDIASAAGLEFLGLSDLTADGKDDLLFRDSAGVLSAWILNGVTLVSDSDLVDASSRSSAWRVAGFADVNGDRKADIIWQHQSAGAVYAWFMDGARRVGGGQIAPSVGASWRVVGTPDLNGDGKSDLLWRNLGSGSTNAWMLDGTERIDSGFIRTVSNSWQSIK